MKRRQRKILKLLDVEIAHQTSYLSTNVKSGWPLAYEFHRDMRENQINLRNQIDEKFKRISEIEDEKRH